MYMSQEMPNLQRFLAYFLPGDNKVWCVVSKEKRI